MRSDMQKRVAVATWETKAETKQMSNCVPLSWNQRGGWRWRLDGGRGGQEGGTKGALVCCLREVKRNVLHVRTHEPGRLFAPYASLNTSPTPSDGTLSPATQVSPPVSQPPPMRPHVSQGLGLIAWVGAVVGRGERGCLVLLWGPKPVNDAGHQKPHRWLI